ncbi:MAG: bifunctional UDP-N-acetylglucosamine diphosphorylase/glucosamine-1-phosphate N-acetyltransferase GlmU [Gammaproteobacteria bacterium]
MEVVVLAAGKGTRMYSSQPKVLHSIGGQAMLERVLTTASKLKPKNMHVVVGFGADAIEAHFANSPLSSLNWVTQSEQLGTGHAVQQAISEIDTSTDDNQVLVLFGDVPLISEATLQDLIAQSGPDTLSLLTVVTPEPHGLGRIIRNDLAQVEAIVEHRDANAQQLLINEINTGIMAIPAAKLARWLNMIGNNNEQKEYYLTDIVALAAKEGCKVTATQASDDKEVMGVNDKVQLALLERHYQGQKMEALLRSGVTLRDPTRVDVRGNLTCGRDVEIDSNVIFEGNVALSDNVIIGANTVIKDAKIGAGTQILAGTHIDGAEIGEHVTIGPTARIRPGTVLHNNVKVGNFVEIKKSTLGEGSKANHLAYIGDAVLGTNCNIGAGTIFCNYDGANKHKTVIGNNVFVGSNSVLVAPVALQDNAFVAAGSVINTDVPSEHLAVARGKQRNIAGWKRPTKDTGSH